MKYELVNFCEFDKYAETSYCAIHGVDKSLNLGDITKVNEKEIADFNMMTWGFPCTDISVAGKQKGFIDTDGDKTRSGLYYDGIRILKEKIPYISIIENVKNLTGKKFKSEFEQILSDLDDAGYNSYWQVLNAKNYGIPQNRERVFIVSIRKDVDNGIFKFPEPFDIGLRLKDFLEQDVAESFYISQEKVEKLISQIKNKDTLMFDTSQSKREEFLREYNEFSPTLNSRDYKDPRLVNLSVNIVGKLSSSQDGVVISPEGISPTHTAGHGNCPKILENKVVQVGNIVDTGNWGNPQRGRIYSPDGCSPALNCNYIMVIIEKEINTIYLLLKNNEKAKEKTEEIILDNQVNERSDYNKKSTENKNKQIETLW